MPKSFYISFYDGLYTLSILNKSPLGLFSSPNSNSLNLIACYLIILAVGGQPSGYTCRFESRLAACFRKAEAFVKLKLSSDYATLKSRCCSEGYCRADEGWEMHR